MIDHSGQLLQIIVTKRFTVKGTVHQKFCHYLLTPMLMESQVTFRSPENISRASQKESVFQHSHLQLSTKEAWGLVLKRIKTKQL